ncbi:MAG: response regulator [Anaerolinea sp.]|nr:response regulator [Anaerolinea sp.]
MTQMILVIADDIFMQEALGDLLQYEGFTRVVAKDRAEGLRIFCQRQKEVSLVVLDIGAANDVDFTLYDDLQAVDPSVKLLVSTSYDEREVKRRYREKVPFQVLYKPYDAQSFLDTVSRMRA